MVLPRIKTPIVIPTLGSGLAFCPPPHRWWRGAEFIGNLDPFPAKGAKEWSDRSDCLLTFISFPLIPDRLARFASLSNQGQSSGKLALASSLSGAALRELTALPYADLRP